MGQTKLALDDAVAGDSAENEGESASEKLMKASLISVLRQNFDRDDREKSKSMELPTKEAEISLVE